MLLLKTHDVGLPQTPVVEVTALSEYSAQIVIQSEEINASPEKEQLFVVRYRSLPHVGISLIH